MQWRNPSELEKLFMPHGLGRLPDRCPKCGHGGCGWLPGINVPRTLDEVLDDIRKFKAKREAESAEDVPGVG